MTLLVLDRDQEEKLIAARKASGADRFDEVWEGTYVMSPLANNEHQEIVADFMELLVQVVKRPGLGRVFPGANVSDDREDWTRNYRAPDVAVYLSGNPARDCGTHWLGGPDFAAEVVSLYDRSRAKLPFYAKVGVREVLIVDRDPWGLELYRIEDGEFASVGASTLENPEALASGVLPLGFRLVPGDSRPGIEVSRADGGPEWLV